MVARSIACLNQWVFNWLSAISNDFACSAICAIGVLKKLRRPSRFYTMDLNFELGTQNCYRRMPKPSIAALRMNLIATCFPALEMLTVAFA